MTVWSEHFDGKGRMRLLTLLLGVFFLGIFALWILDDLMGLQEEAADLYEQYYNISDSLTDTEKKLNVTDTLSKETLSQCLKDTFKHGYAASYAHYGLISEYLNTKATLILARTVAVIFPLALIFLLVIDRLMRVGREDFSVGGMSGSSDDNKLSLNSMEHELLQSLPLGMISIGSDKNVTMGNLSARQILDSLEVGSPIPDIRISEIVDASIKGEPGRDVVSFSVNNEEKRIQVDSYPLSGNRGAVILLTDKTKLMELEARTLRSEKLSALAQLTAGLSHEINNPVTAISSLAESLLEELPQDSPLREDFEIIEENAHRCRTIIQRLLDFARPHHSPRLGLDHDPCDVHKILDNILDLAELQSKASSITIRRDFAEYLPALNTDVELLKQMFYNIVQNAIDALEGKGTITVCTCLDQRAGSSAIAVLFRDTGSGISEEVKEKVFEPFYTTKAETNGSSGVGMGLAIVSSIAERLGGEVTLKSKIGEGTTVKVVIPLRIGG